ncbi:MAG: aldehyde dehydrogenase family protein [Acidobacteria bacterium]|nr:aldehyde dehydrogenase family protein [Acidobacteriota bacterium]HNT99831.1 aldehyde dehydrogenase family protein [Acidobacteriota bacterium]
MQLDQDLMAVQEVRHLLRLAADAQRRFAEFSQEQVDRVVEAVSREALAHAEELARLAVQETGFGRVEDKVTKNTFAAREIFEDIRNLKTVGVVAEDPAQQVYEIAVPMGVVAGIIPSTNPTSTTIFKALISLKGRNAVVFSPHPAAKDCIAKTADILHAAAVLAGAPEGIVGCLRNPTLEATEELMRHRLTAVILATGGHGLVKAAYGSGKPAFGVGPGNVPAFIERTAQAAAAVELVLAGKCFDNGTVCASEQAVIVDRPLLEAVRTEFTARGAHFCSPAEKRLLEAAVVQGGRINPRIVGRDAAVIAELAGFKVPAETPCLIAELAAVGPQEPLSMEKLSPVLAFYAVDGWLEGCARCIELLTYGGMGHSMVIHSQDQDVIMRFALEKPAFRILANTSGTHGAIGYATGLTPSLTLGCGTWGNNITTDNVSARHLVNIKRLAFGTRPIRFTRASPERPAAAPPAPSTPPAGPVLPDRDRVRGVVAQVIAEMMATDAPAGRPAVPPAGDTPPADDRPPAPVEMPKPADFVGEQEVLAAVKQNQRIIVSDRTRMTPLARDLGEQHRVFQWIEDGGPDRSASKSY